MTVRRNQDVGLLVLVVDGSSQLKNIKEHNKKTYYNFLETQSSFSSGSFQPKGNLELIKNSEHNICHIHYIPGGKRC